MIPELERNTRNCPRGVCFLFEGRTYVNAQIRLQAAGLARALQLQGVRRGSFVACDMDNSPALVLLAVAAGYGGFALVALNRRLTDAEKDERLSDLERNGYHVAARLDENDRRWHASRGKRRAHAPRAAPSRRAFRCAFQSG
mgnify:CR=1 FL=1